MVTRYIDFRERSKRSGIHLAELTEMVSGISGISKAKVLDAFTPTHTQRMIIEGQDYNFIDVLSTITNAGYAIAVDKIIKGEQK
jgi:hypothetical protein